MSERKRVLILCTGNSCRSQMAEGWVNHLLPDAWEACSAGTAPAAVVHPLAIRAMGEVGVDISGHVPRHVEALFGQSWDMIITVCDSAKETCPYYPGPAERRHISFPDPASAQGSEAERLAVFRRVRDDIRSRLVSALDASR
jgi:arsenate reductase